jgi:putative ABC transport system permease protein
VHERLGDTRTLISSGTSYFENSWINDSIFGKKAHGVLRVNGFVAIGGRMIPVAVWGVDDKNIEPNNAKINPKLATEINLQAGEELVLRLPAAGLVPSGSLFVTDSYTTSLRLELQDVVDVKNGGNIALDNVQQTPYNIFLNRENLAEAMNAAGKINLIFSPENISSTQIANSWTPAISGVKVMQHKDFSAVTSEQIFMPQKIVDAICKKNGECNRLFSYLVNGIAKGKNEVPYSFATAIDFFDGQKLSNNEAILPDYTARRVGAKTGDSITLSYFVASSGLKNLTEKHERFFVKKIVPLRELVADSTLSAEFPGLSDVESCTDWDSDLPINMEKIEQEDEDFWEKYSSTPKILIAYEKGKEIWKNDFGSATAVRISNKKTADLSAITPEIAGVNVAYPYEIAMKSAVSGVDFSSLFLSLGFFIVIAALLLVAMPISQMLYARRKEVELFSALGYSKKRIALLLFREAIPVITISAIVGAALSVAYTQVVLWLLNGVWKGATHTEGIAIHISLAPIIAAIIIVAILSSLIVWFSLRKTKKRKKINKKNAAYGSFSVHKKVIAFLRADKKGTLLSFISLSIGVFLIFVVGLNRRGFADASQLASGTGGYTFWGESSVPIYHDLTTTEGREKLGLKGLPNGVEILQLLRWQADDASCLNLNKPAEPTILGVDLKTLGKSSIKIAYPQPPKGGYNGRQGTYPVYADATVITWGLMKAVGDTLTHRNALGNPITLRIAGALSNTIFQGALLIDRTLFAQLWGSGKGSEIMLVKCAKESEEQVKNIMEKSMYNYGLMLTPTAQRLAEFNSVTDTYLTIFMTLGALGLLVGIIAFVVAVRKNLAMRHSETNLYRALGFSDKRVKNMLLQENLIVPILAIAVGFFGALISLAKTLENVGGGIWLLAFSTVIALVCCAVLFINFTVKKCVEK